jgi:hypothetical protein
LNPFKAAQLMQAANLWKPLHTTKIYKEKIQQDATMYQILLFHIYIKLNMFQVTYHPSSGA